MRRTFATLRAAVAKSPPLPAPLHLEPVKATVDAAKFAALSPVDRIKLIFDTHGEKAVQLASMQRTSSVLMHHIYRAQVPLPILFFDTQYLHQVCRPPPPPPFPLVLFSTPPYSRIL